MVKQYVGARYVPKFASPVEWASNTSYEALTIVTFNNASYTSKIPVPPTVGNPADNPDYWALTGNYNAQVEQYRQETEGYRQETEGYKTQVDGYRQDVTNVENSINAEKQAREQADTNIVTGLNSFYNAISLNGKKILIIGDSISDPTLLANNWAVQFKVMCEKFGASVDIDGKSGYAITKYADDNKSLYTRWKEDTASKTYDYLIIQLGTNDQALNHTFGDIQAEFASLREDLDRLSHPTVVYFITPFKKADTRFPDAINMVLYYAYFEDMCKWFNFSIIDGGSVPNLYIPNGNQTKYFLNDSYLIHPNELGSSYIAEYVFKKFISGGSNSVGMYRGVFNGTNFLAEDLRSTGSTATISVDSHFNIDITINIVNITIDEAPKSKTVMNSINEILNYSLDGGGGGTFFCRASNNFWSFVRYVRGIGLTIFTSGAYSGPGYLVYHNNFSMFYNLLNKEQHEV